MKRILTIAVSLFVISASCFAQEAPAQKKHNGERAQAEKIGYITQKLQLTPEEAQVFWPVYNQYAAAAKEAKVAVINARKALRRHKDEPEIPEKEMLKRIDAYLAACKAETAVLSDFNAKFLKVLPAEKVGKLYVAEAQYGKNMLNHLAGRGPKKGGAPCNGQHPEHHGAAHE